MSKIAIVYWSGSGNTEAMAELIAQGAKGAGAAVDLFKISDFSEDKLTEYDVFAFGCPAMGAEVLEENEFQPAFTLLEPALSGKKVALFGSYGWGTGEWMEKWAADCQEKGINLVNDNLIVNEAPAGDSVTQCKEWGEALAGK